MFIRKVELQSWLIDKTRNCSLPSILCQQTSALNSQIALDEAAFLMDLASVKGTWDDSVDRIGKCYEEAGLHDIAQFVRYQE